MYVITKVFMEYVNIVAVTSEYYGSVCEGCVWEQIFITSYCRWKGLHFWLAQ